LQFTVYDQASGYFRFFAMSRSFYYLVQHFLFASPNTFCGIAGKNLDF